MGKGVREMTKEALELIIGAGSFMLFLQLLCLSYLAESCNGLWATFAVVALGFCLLWCFDDYLPVLGEKRGRR